MQALGNAAAYLRQRAQARIEIARLLPLAGRPLAVSAVLGNLLAGLAPVGFVVATSILAGRLPAAAAGGWHSAAGRAVVWSIVAAGFALAVQQALTPLLAVVGERIGRRIDSRIRDRLAAASSSSATVAALEDEELLRLLAEAGGELEYNPNTPGRAVTGLLALIARYTPPAAAAVLIGAVYSWPAAAALVAGALLIRYGIRRGLVAEHLNWRANLGSMRESWYFRGLALDRPAAKEMRVFALAPWVQSRHQGALQRLWTSSWPLRRRVYWTLMARYVAVALVLAAATVVWLGHSAARGHVSLRDTALVLQAGFLLMRVGVFFMESDVATEFGMGAYGALRGFETRSRQRYGPLASGVRDASDVPVRSIRFEGVSFAYPGSSRPVLDGLQLELPAGRSLALVGLNGAGKTTLIKLLARLYEPTEGRITADGIDLRELELASWRSRVAAIFQDFIHYELSAAENIGFGAPARLDDVAGIRRAAERAGALELVEALPAGLETPLSARYEGGVDLSGGQWQRVALARALFALQSGASVLVLDEPTANLDVRAEAELFNRFIDLTAGVTTILISHRFSTVRRADRIAVLEHGRVVEEGTHDELVARGGRYSELFLLQAARFADNGGPG